MTFDDWWKEMKPAECDELKDEFVACWQARDAKIAELKRLQVAYVIDERDKLRKQVTLLRDVLHFAYEELKMYAEEEGEDYNSPEINEALAATEQEENEK